MSVCAKEHEHAAAFVKLFNKWKVNKVYRIVNFIKLLLVVGNVCNVNKLNYEKQKEIYKLSESSRNLIKKKTKSIQNTKRKPVGKHKQREKT